MIEIFIALSYFPRGCAEHGRMAESAPSGHEFSKELALSLELSNIAAADYLALFNV